MTDPIAAADGRDGVVRLYGDRIEIAREGLLAKGAHFGQGDRTVPLDLVADVTYEGPAGVTAGELVVRPLGWAGSDEYTESAYAVRFGSNADAFETVQARFHEVRPDGPADLTVREGVDETLGDLVCALTKGDRSREAFDRQVRPAD